MKRFRIKEVVDGDNGIKKYYSESKVWLFWWDENDIFIKPMNDKYDQPKDTCLGNYEHFKTIPEARAFIEDKNRMEMEQGKDVYIECVD